MFSKEFMCMSIVLTCSSLASLTMNPLINYKKRPRVVALKNRRHPSFPTFFKLKILMISIEL